MGGRIHYQKSFVPKMSKLLSKTFYALHTLTTNEKDLTQIRFGDLTVYNWIPETKFAFFRAYRKKMKLVTYSGLLDYYYENVCY